MATKMQQKLQKALKNDMNLGSPWSLLPKTIPYAPSYHYPLRTGTMPPFVNRYLFFIEAAQMFSATKGKGSMPFILVEKHGVTTSYTHLEGLQTDGSRFVCSLHWKGSDKYTLQMSQVENDGSWHPVTSFATMDSVTLTYICLTLMPSIIATDCSAGNGKITAAIQEIGKAGDTQLKSPWTNANEIPDIAKEAAYYLDACMSVIKNMTIDCGPDNTDTPAEISNSPLSEKLVGKLISKNLDCAGGVWSPIVVEANGKSTIKRNQGVTISDAKAEYSVYSAHRQWTEKELKLIPSFPDEMLVMPEVLRMANRIVKTHDDLNPVCNLMWRGETGFGKSTGLKQLACILNVPFLVQPCHPSMEAQDLKSQFVPVSSPEEDALLLDAPGKIANSKKAYATTGTDPIMDAAINHIATLTEQEQSNLFDKGSEFFELALMDQDQAETNLFGNVQGFELPELLSTYSQVCLKMQQQSYECRIKKLEESKPEETEQDNKPAFVHVLSPYIQAMTNGWIVELQEASRIRDSGVLVSINEFDRPGAMLPLMNGKMAVRHKDAICVISDNVGYSSCRPIDPSVIRRQNMIIDSYDLPENILKDRARWNTGVTDPQILDTAYKLWDCVRSYCAQNSITDGSVSPVELERLVQALKYDGMDSLQVNLDDCVISKSTSSIEDQREIREACMTLVSQM